MIDTKTPLTLGIKNVKDAGSGEFEAVLSVPTVDRDGEVIDAKAFEPLPDHITIDLDHGMSAESTIGSGTPYYDGDTLMFRGSFAADDVAQRIRSRVVDGHIRTMSVAFMNAEREKDEKDGKVHIRKAELLNAAIVAIPSNREALITAAKAYAAEVADAKVGARNSAKDAELIQSLHDTICALGAKCADAEASDSDPEAEKTTNTDPEVKAAADAAAEPPADVDVAKARMAIVAAQAELALLS